MNRVFVYGSLLKGLHNHDLLKLAECGGSKATAEANYTMFDLGSFPGVATGGFHSVTGEVYEVDELTLYRLDRLEGHPHFYVRTMVLLSDGKAAYMYCLSKQYMMRTGVGELPVVTSGDWRRYINERGWES